MTLLISDPRKRNLLKNNVKAYGSSVVKNCSEGRSRISLKQGEKVILYSENIRTGYSLVLIIVAICVAGMVGYLILGKTTAEEGRVNTEVSDSLLSPKGSITPVDGEDELVSDVSGSEVENVSKNSVSANRVLAPLEMSEMDVFPNSTFSSSNSGDFKGSSEFVPSAGPWSGHKEENVFQFLMKHKQDPLNSYELRIGTGGQIYSLFSEFGESVPPSWRDPKGHHQSPWNDEVWQFVSVCKKYNKLDDVKYKELVAPYRAGYFVHNSGCYVPHDLREQLGIDNVYCPLLGSNFDEINRTYQQLNWGLVPQVKTINRSPLLYYLQVRDAGEGAIELTWIVHNFSVRDDIVFDHLNAPWGGTRVTSLPFQYISNPDGTIRKLNMVDGNGVNSNVSKTGGFTLSSVDESPNSQSLSLVYGLDKNYKRERAKKAKGLPYAQDKPSLIRYGSRPGMVSYKRAWKNWKTRPAESFRNYDVLVLIPKLLIAPQTSIWFRSYLVVGEKQKCVKIANDLVDHVDYGLMEFSDDVSEMTNVLDQKGNTVFKLYKNPVKGTLPIFSLRHEPTGKTVYTTDPYYFTPQEPLSLNLPKDDEIYDYLKDAVGYTLDAKTEFLGILGYGFKDKPGEKGWSPLSTFLDESQFGTANTYHVDVWVKP